MKRLSILVLCTSVLSTACFQTRILFNQQGRSGVRSTDWDGNWYHDLIFGLAEISGPIKLETVCPSGVSYAEQETSFLNGLVTALVGYGLYSPQTVTIYCSGGGAAKVTLDGDGNPLSYASIDPAQSK